MGERGGGDHTAAESKIELKHRRAECVKKSLKMSEADKKIFKWITKRE
jgi:hypothetical protein